MIWLTQLLSQLPLPLPDAQIAKEQGFAVWVAMMLLAAFAGAFALLTHRMFKYADNSDKERIKLEEFQRTVLVALVEKNSAELQSSSSLRRDNVEAMYSLRNAVLKDEKR